MMTCILQVFVDGESGDCNIDPLSRLASSFVGVGLAGASWLKFR